VRDYVKDCRVTLSELAVVAPLLGHESAKNSATIEQTNGIALNAL
jgi:hypothetical protein